VQVNCSVADAPDTARIIAVFARAGGSSFVISRGTTDHVVAGMKLRLGGVPEPATIEACDRRTCTATITVAPDLVKAARPVVTFLK
jgi:hypothetical protein